MRATISVEWRSGVRGLMAVEWRSNWQGPYTTLLDQK